MLKQLTNNWEIPELSEERLSELVAQIKPMVKKENGDLYYIEDVDPVKTAFTFSPTFTKKAENYVKIGEAFSLHSSYPGLWKPSMEEIFSFIQNHKDIAIVNSVSVSFLDHHESGNGNIGRISLYS